MHAGLGGEIGTSPHVGTCGRSRKLARAPTASPVHHKLEAGKTNPPPSQRQGGDSFKLEFFG